MGENINKSQKSQTDTEINSTNIFDEFESNNSNLIEEVERLKKESKKDIYYYLNISTKVIWYLFWIFLLFLIISYVYVYIQKNENIYNKGFLDPICWIIMWDSPSPDEFLSCSSITFSKKYYEQRLSRLKITQTEKILPLVSLVYERENFLKSKEISFLLDKSENKFRVLDILEKFDSLKNSFTWISKSRVTCSDINLDWDDKIFSLKCEAFSSNFDNDIIWYSWTRSSQWWSFVQWTSISIANSFLNYIEKNSNDFTLFDRQKTFSNTSVVWDQSWYTTKTQFDVKLKINF